MSFEVRPTGTDSTSQSQTTTQSLGKDDFLKLLVMQLRFQDPMNPMNGTEFASQLAQFSSVEQLSNINTNLSDSLKANALLSQSINNALSATMIGNEVRATSDTFQYDGTTDATLGYTLESAADTITVKIYNEAGTLVRTITQAPTEKGDNVLEWDGKDKNGVKLDAGKYTFEVQAKNSKGESIDTSTYISGIVSSVRFKSDGGYFIIDGIEIPLANILEIKKG